MKIEDGYSMNFGSLFAGIGGIDLGLERAGMTCAWQIEIDEFCRKILNKHWPSVPKYIDVKDCNKSNLANVDLIAGGFPCQPVSQAGKKEGEKDERWLWDDFYRLICEIKPRWIMVENVTGLLSTRNGKLFGGILRDLSTCGYDAEWQTIPAIAIGRPHERKRVFLIAYSTSIRPSKVEVFKRKPCQRNRQRWADQPGIYIERIKRKSISIPQDIRMDDGFSYSLDDTMRTCGNAVVPQVAEFIGRIIMEANETLIR